MSKLKATDWNRALTAVQTPFEPQSDPVLPSSSNIVIAYNDNFPDESIEGDLG